MLQKWKHIICNWINCYFDESDPEKCNVNIKSLLNIISYLRDNLNLDESRSSVLGAHTIEDFILEKYPSFKFENGTAVAGSEDDVYLVASLLLFFVCVNSKDVDIKSAMCNKLSAGDQEIILKFSKNLMECSPITYRDVQSAITEACCQNMATVETASVKVAETPPALRSLHGEVRRLQAALEAERFDRNYLQEELSRTNLKVEKLMKDKEKYKLDIMNLTAKISMCCGGEQDARGAEAGADEAAALLRQLHSMEERLVTTQEQLADAIYERDDYKKKFEHLKQDRDQWAAISQQESARAGQLAEELEAERRHLQSLKELVNELSQHNRLNRLDSSQLECDDPDTSIKSLPHNLSVCSEACANVIEVQLCEERAKVDALRQQVETLQKENEQLQFAIEEDNSTREVIINEKDSVIDKLEKQLKQQSLLLTSLRKDHEEVVLSFENYKIETKSVIEDRNEQIKQLNDCLNTLRRQYHDLQSVRNDLNKKVEVLNKQMMDLEKNHESEKQKLHKALSQESSKCSMLVQDKEILHKQLIEERSAKDVLEAEQTHLHENYKHVVAEKKEWLNEKMILAQQLADEKSLREMLEEQKNTLTTQHATLVQTMSKQMKNIKKKLSKEVSKNKTLMQDKDSQRKLLENTVSANQLVENEKNALLLEKNVLEEKLVEFENIKEELSQQVNELIDKTSSLEKQYKNEISVNEKLNEEMKVLIENLSVEKCCKDELTKEKEFLVIEVESLKQDLTTQKALHDKDREVILAEKEKLVKSLEEEKAARDEIETERQKLSSKVNELNEEYTAKVYIQQDELATLAEQVRVLQVKCDDFETLNQQISNTVTLGLNKLVQDLKNEVIKNELLKKLINNEIEHMSVVDVCNLLVTVADSLVMDVKARNSLEKVIELKDKAQAELQEQLMKAEGQISELRTETERMREVINDAEVELAKHKEIYTITLENKVKEINAVQKENEALTYDLNSVKIQLDVKVHSLKEKLVENENLTDKLKKSYDCQIDNLNLMANKLTNYLKDKSHELEVLRKEKDKLQQTIEENNTAIKSLQEEVKTEKQNQERLITDFEAERQILKNMVAVTESVMEDQKVTLNNTISEHLKTNETLQEDNRRITEQFENEKTCFEQKIIEKEKAIKQLQAELLEFGYMKEDVERQLIERNEALDAEITSLKTEVNSKEGALTTLREENYNLASIIASYKDNLNTCEKEKSELKINIDAVEVESRNKVDKLTVSLHELMEHKQLITSELEERTEYITEMENKLKQFESKIKDLEHEKTKLLHEKDDLYADYAAKLHELRIQLENNSTKDAEDINKLNVCNSNLAEENTKLKNSLVEMEAELLKLKQINTQLSDELDKVKKYNTELGIEYNQLKNINMQFTEENNKYKKYIDDLEKDLNDNKKLNLQLKSELDELKRINVAYEEQVYTLKTSNTKLEQELCEFKKENTELNGKVETLNKQNIEAQEELDKLKKYVTELEEELAKLKQHNTDIVEVLGTLKNENNSLEQQLGKYKKENKQMEEGLGTLKGENSNITEQIKNITTHYEDELNKFKQYNTNITEELASLKNDNNELKQELLKYKNDKSQLEGDLGKFNTDNKTLAENLDTLKNDFNKLEREHSNLKKHNSELERVLGETKNVKTDLEVELNNLKEHNTTQAKECDKLKNHNEQLQGELEQLKKNNMNLKDKLNILKKNDQVATEENNRMKKIHLDLEKELVELKECKLSLTEECDRLNKDITKLETELSQTKTNNTMLGEELNKFMEKHELVTEENYKLKKTNTELEVGFKEHKNSATEEFDKLKQQIARLEGELRQSRSNNIEIETELNKVKNDNTVAEEEINKLKIEIKNLTEAANELQKCNKDLTQEVSELKNHKIDLSQTIIKLEKENVDLTKEILKKSSEITELQQAIKHEQEKHQKSIEDTAIEKVTLANKCDILQDYHNKAEKELDERQKEIVSLQKEVQTLQAKVELCNEDSKAKDGIISKMSKEKDAIISSVNKALQEEKELKEKYLKDLEEKTAAMCELKMKVMVLNSEREALNILKKENAELIKAVGYRETLAVRSQDVPACQKYSGQLAERDVRDLHHQVDNTSDLTHSSEESLKTITDLEKIIQDKNRTITTLQSDVTYLKTLMAESETKLLDVTKDLEVSKESCQQLSSQLKKIVHQKNEEIAELKKQVNKMSVTENRATQIIKVSAKYQAMILKRIAEIKSNTVLKELTNFGNSNNQSDNELRRSLNAGSITMEDLENFLETTERHLMKCKDKQISLQKERDRLSEVNRINESEIINLKKFLTELSVGYQSFSSVRDVYAQKLSRVISVQRTVRREILSLDGRVTDACMLKLERGYAAAMQDLAECAMTLERWVERCMARTVSPEKIKQAFVADPERGSLAPASLQNTGLEVQLDELDNSFQKLLEEAGRTARLPAERARDQQAQTVLEVRAEYEDKLNRMKAKMKQLYTEQIAVFKEKQKEEIAALEKELERARDKLAASSRAYEQHIRGLTSELWDVGEKFLVHKNEAEYLRRRQHRSGSLMSLQHVHSSGLVPSTDQSSRPSEAYSLRSLPMNNHENKREGRGLHMSDEEGEVFDNRCLKELSTPRRESIAPETGGMRLSELRWRNSLCPPHLKSSYPAETQFVHALNEEEIKAMGGVGTAGVRQQRKEVGITAYKKPGPPTPSKQAGRLSATDSELRESLRVEADPQPSRKTSTPSRIRSLFRSSKTDTVEGTPRSRKLSSIFKKK